MIGPRGGFTHHDNAHGFRGSCPCGWSGPWRGYALTEVEEDVMEHWGSCPERVYGSATMGATYTKCPGDASTSRGVAQTWRSEQ